MKGVVITKRVNLSQVDLRTGVFRRDDARFLFRRILENHQERGLPVLALSFERNAVMVLLAGNEQAWKPQLRAVFDYFSRRFNTRYQRSGAVFRTKWIAREVEDAEAFARTMHDAALAAATALDETALGAGTEPWCITGFPVRAEAA